MSTEYEIGTFGSVVMRALEHSSKMDSQIEDTVAEIIIRDLEPNELWAIGVELMRVAEYNDPDLVSPPQALQDEARRILGRE